MTLEAIYEYIKTLEGKIEEIDTGGSDITFTDLRPTGSIYLKNGKYIYGETTDEISKAILGVSTSNNVFLGSSSYADVGNTNIYAGTGSIQLFTSLGAVLLYKDATAGYNVFRPNNTGTYLGSNSYRWLNVYCQAVNSTGAISGTTITGSGLVTGSGFRVSGRSSNIGSVIQNTSGTRNIASGTTAVQLSDNFTLPAGTWLILGGASFESNSTGRRSLSIYNVTSASNFTHTYVNQQATASTASRLRTMHVVTPTADTQYRLNCYQTSGSTLEVTWYWEVTRIA